MKQMNADAERKVLSVLARQNKIVDTPTGKSPQILRATSPQLAQGPLFRCRLEPYGGSFRFPTGTGGGAAPFGGRRPGSAARRRNPGLARHAGLGFSRIGRLGAPIPGNSGAQWLCAPD